MLIIVKKFQSLSTCGGRKPRLNINFSETSNLKIPLHNTPAHKWLILLGLIKPPHQWPNLKEIEGMFTLAKKGLPKRTKSNAAFASIILLWKKYSFSAMISLALKRTLILHFAWKQNLQKANLRYISPNFSKLQINESSTSVAEWGLLNNIWRSPIFLFPLLFISDTDSPTSTNTCVHKHKNTHLPTSLLHV